MQKRSDNALFVFMEGPIEQMSVFFASTFHTVDILCMKR